MGLRSAAPMEEAGVEKRSKIGKWERDGSGERDLGLQRSNKELTLMHSSNFPL